MHAVADAAEGGLLTVGFGCLAPFCCVLCSWCCCCCCCMTAMDGSYCGVVVVMFIPCASQEWLLGTRRGKGPSVQKGIISAITVPPSSTNISGSSSSSRSGTWVACGNQSGSIGLYDLRSKKTRICTTDADLQSGAVTQVCLLLLLLLSLSRKLVA